MASGTWINTTRMRQAQSKKQHKASIRITEAHTEELPFQSHQYITYSLVHLPLPPPSGTNNASNGIT
ncbi:unnamed protein product [Diplocarpon coronariae]